jgi:hypothetical protein
LSALQSFACGALAALLLRLLAVLRRRRQRMQRSWQLRELQLMAELEKATGAMLKWKMYTHTDIYIYIYK